MYDEINFRLVDDPRYMYSIIMLNCSTHKFMQLLLIVHLLHIIKLVFFYFKFLSIAASKRIILYTVYG